MKIDEIGIDFRNFEKDLQLFDLKIRNIYFWKLIRFEIFGLLVEGILNLEITHPDGRKTNPLLEKIKYKVNDFRFLRENALFSPIYMENLILTSPRKIQFNNYYECPITMNLSKILNKSNNSFFFESDYSVKTNSNQSMQYFIAPSTLKYLLRKVVFISKDNNIIVNTIEQKIFELFYIKINLKHIIKIAISDFTIDYFYANIIFKKRKNLSHLYLVTSYGKEGFIAAAKNNNVRTTEFQHGVIDENHPGYSYSVDFIPYLPDNFILFGKYWYKYLSNLKNKQFSYEAPFFMKNYSLNSEIKVNKSKILIISDTIQTSKILYDINNIIDLLINKTFNLKLHPNEYNTWMKRPNISLFNDKKNTRVIDNNNIHVYELILESAFVIGTTSTLILESIALGKKPIILCLEGYETFKFENLEEFIIRVYSIKELLFVLNKAAYETTKFIKSNLYEI